MYQEWLIIITWDMTEMVGLEFAPAEEYKVFSTICYIV